MDRGGGAGHGASIAWYVPAIPPPTCTGDELLDLLTAPVEPPFAGELVVVGGPPEHHGPDTWAAAQERLALLPCVVVGGPAWTGAARELVDAVAVGDELEAIAATVAAAPVASAGLALHLRGHPRRVAEGLAAESALYSTLQGGAEHRAWRGATPVRHRPPPDGPVVAVRRDGDELVVELDRPEVRNAVDVRLRDELLAALAVAEADPSLTVTLRGRGPAFCAGGDLDEFGSGPDPARAHLVRLRRSLGAVLARLAPRTTVHLHGACWGAGIELAAFAGRVTARPGTRIALPELGLGLVPGAGGTVSLPARIGRHRTAWLALTRREVDAETARAWGLVDEIALV